MKKIIITFFLIAIAATGHAQIITSSSRKVKVHEEQAFVEGKTSKMFVGLGGAGCEDFGAIVAEFNYLKALSRTFSDNVVPFVGGGVGLGVSPDEGVYVHLQPFVGVMLGGPSLRFDLRLAPTFMVCDEGYFGILIEPGVWFSNFFFGGGLGYDILEGGLMGMGRIGLSF